MNVVSSSGHGEWPPPPVRRAVPGHNAGPCSSAPRSRRERPAVRQSAQVARCAKWLAPPRRQGAPARRRGLSFFATQPLSQKKSPSVERFASIPSAASKTRSSSMVMSQFSITRARMRSPWGASFDFFQPPYLSALIVPRCFQRLHQLHNKADAHIKLLRRRIARGPRFNNSNNSFTKIFRIKVVSSMAGLL